MSKAQSRWKRQTAKQNNSMAKIERFEDMLSWQKSRELTRRVYDLSKSGEFARDFELRGQMRSASISIALDQSYITPVEFENLSSNAIEVGRLVSGFMGYLQKSDLRGNKFKRA